MPKQNGSRIAGPLTDRASALWRTPVTACYALILLSSDTVMALLSPDAQRGLARAASTNIAQLATEPLLVLPASAVVDASNGWIWAPLTLLLVGGIERRLGAGRAVVVTFGAHVVATLVSEGILLVQINRHLQPRSAAHMLDVGPSYVLLAALAGCLVIGSWRLRAAALVVGVLIVPGLLTQLPHLDMSSVGHFTALVLGAAFAGALRTPQRASTGQREQRTAYRTALAVRGSGPAAAQRG